MKRNINKNIIYYILLIYLIIQPLLDMISGLNKNYSINIKLNIYIRILFLFISIIYLLFICKSKYKKISIKYLILLFIYFIFYFTLTNINNNLYLEELKNNITVFYFPISLITLFNMKEEYKIKINNKTLFISLLIYLLLLLIPNTLNISSKTYIDGIGHLGFFYSANSISAIISFLLPFSIIYLKTKKQIIPFLILYTYIILSIGTKTLIINLLIIIIINIIYMIKKSNNKKKNKIIILTLLILSIFSIFMIPKTAVYKNIEKRANFLKVKNEKDFIENFDAIILGRRIQYLKKINKYYLKSSINNKLLGLKYTSNIKSVEMDLFDIFYKNGLVGFIIYFLPLIYIIKKKKILSKHKNFEYINNICALIIIVLTTLITGHTITEPNVSIYISNFISNYKNKKSI